MDSGVVDRMPAIYRIMLFALIAIAPWQYEIIAQTTDEKISHASAKKQPYNDKKSQKQEASINKNTQNNSESNTIDTAQNSSEKDTEHARRDLIAQESMARWAFWTMWATFVGVFISAIGLRFVWINLRQIKADLNLTRQDLYLSRQAERAYVYPADELTLKNWMLYATLQNVGRTQANLLGYAVRYLDAFAGDELSEAKRPREPQVQLAKCIESGNKTTIGPFTPPPMSTTIIVLDVFYMDTFRNKCRSVCCYQKTGPVWMKIRRDDRLGME